MKQKHVFTVTGMTCDHCAIAIKNALNQVPGVSANVSYAEGKAWIEAPQKIGAEALLQIVRESGYMASPTDVLPQKFVIVGSGSAAFAAAIRLASAGKQVTMIEKGTMGGTCVNVGCVPSKIFIRQGDTAQTIRQNPFPGILTQNPAIQFEKLRAQQQARVEELRLSKYAQILQIHPNIQFLQGAASFLDAHTISVTDDNGRNSTIQSDRILIATGGRPSIPNIPGLEDTPFWTSTDALSSTKLPQHLLIIGGGFVACEIGQSYRHMGIQVSLFIRGEQLLSGMDPDLGTGLGNVFRDEGIKLNTKTVISRVMHDGTLFTLKTDQGTFSGDALLIATGRTPNTDQLNLVASGVRTDDRGHILVDSHLRTNIPHIFSAGDCTPLPPFVYVAASSGTKAASNMMETENILSLSLVPEVIFTNPAVAVVGLTEKAALEQGLRIETRTLPLEAVPRALANFETRGLIKIVAESESGRILGIHVLSDQAGEVIQSAHLAIRNRMTVSELGEVLFPYLTMVEGLKLAAQSFVKDVSELSCCAG